METPGQENKATFATIGPVDADGYVAVRAGLAQLDRLFSLGVISAPEYEAARKAGGLEVRLPARQVEEFLASDSALEAELEKLARRIIEAGLYTPARLFLHAGRPLSFFGSQLLLLAQPAAKLALGAKDPTGRYSGWLQDRRNVDLLIARLDHLNQERRANRRPANPRPDQVTLSEKESH